MAYAPVAIGDGSKVALIAYPYNREPSYTIFVLATGPGPEVPRYQNLFIVGNGTT
jgi:hypothetical protein